MAQAISSTMATAPSSISNAGRASRTYDSRSSTTSAEISEFECGRSRARACASAFIAASACSRLVPGRSRPTTPRKWLPGAFTSSGVSASGTQSWVVLPGRTEDAGITPTTV